MAGFQYEPIRNEYAGTIAQMLARASEPRAQAATSIAAINARAAENIAQANAFAQMQSGNAWAGAVHGIGQTAAQIPVMLQQQKAQQVGLEREQAQIADIKAQQAQREAAANKQKAIDQQNAVIDGIMQTSMKQDPDTGVFSFDRPTFEQGLVSGGLGHLYPSMAETLDKLDASAAQRNKVGRDMLARTLYGVEQAGYTPDAAISAMAYLKANGLATSDHLQPVLSALADDASPETVKGLVEKLGGALPEFQALRQQGQKQAAELEETKAKTAQTLATTAKTQAEVSGTLPETPAQKATREAAARRDAETQRANQAREAQAAAALAETTRNHKVMEAKPVAAGSAAAVAGALDDAGIDLAATQYRLTKSLPSRNATQNGAIISRAAAQAKALGQSPATVIQKQSAYSADSKALAKMQSMSSAAEAFETKALGQADIIDGLSAKVGRTGIPMLNSWILAGKDHVLGDSDTHQLFNAVTTFAAEYAKIMEGATGSAAGSSDAARKAAERLISAGLTKGQMKDTLALMKKEMALTIQGYDATIGHITSRLGDQPAAAAPAAPAQAAPPAKSGTVGKYTYTVQ